MLVGQHVQWRPGPAPRRQDALHGRRTEGAVADGPLQRRDDVGAAVGRGQRQHPLGLVLAEPAGGQQALQEPGTYLAELREPLPKLLQPSLGVAGRLMVRAATPRGQSGCSAAAANDRS